ncbi:MAG TPA: methyltransferase domain-containing protein [Gammaproteobacteria bacterium]|nr:methyltransferase domain-containing protein [Gammaproteobacteria bacterium]
MSAAERDKWDARYREGAYEQRTHPTALLAEWLPRLRRPLEVPEGGRGRALDVACGTGRNALYLAADGFDVTALDISSVALERGRGAATERGLDVEWLCADLDDDVERALPSREFDLIVWVRYIHRTLMASLIARLAVGGTLLCEQHLATTEPAAGPTSAAFRLAAGDLARTARPLHILHTYEGLIVDPDGRRVALAQLIGRRPA